MPPCLSSAHCIHITFPEMEIKRKRKLFNYSISYLQDLASEIC